MTQREAKKGIMSVLQHLKASEIFIIEISETEFDKFNRILVTYSVGGTEYFYSTQKRIRNKPI